MPLTYNESFETLLVATIRDKMALKAEELGSGSAQDYPGYQRQVGFIYGLKDAIDLCEEVRKTLDER